MVQIPIKYTYDLISDPILQKISQNIGQVDEQATSLSKAIDDKVDILNSINKTLVDFNSSDVLEQIGMVENQLFDYGFDILQTIVDCRKSILEQLEKLDELEYQALLVQRGLKEIDLRIKSIASRLGITNLDSYEDEEMQGSFIIGSSGSGSSGSGSGGTPSEIIVPQVENTYVYLDCGIDSSKVEDFSSLNLLCLSRLSAMFQTQYNIKNENVVFGFKRPESVLKQTFNAQSVLKLKYGQRVGEYRDIGSANDSLFICILQCKSTEEANAIVNRSRGLTNSCSRQFFIIDGYLPSGGINAFPFISQSNSTSKKLIWTFNTRFSSQVQRQRLLSYEGFVCSILLNLLFGKKSASSLTYANVLNELKKKYPEILETNQGEFDKSKPIFT